MSDWVSKAVKGESTLKPYERLVRHWTETKSGLEVVGHAETEIAALEAKYAIRLPDDFRDHLLNSCPGKECYLDDDCIWWELERITNIPDEYKHWTEIESQAVRGHAGKYLFFADYMIWCWAWAIDCGDDENRGRVAVIGSGNDRFVADSFADFIARYLVEPRDLI